MHVPVFELSNVVYRYDSVAALDNITLSIPCGKRVALLGANGSGKSTLLRLLDALYFPVSGSVSFHGQPLEGALFEQHTKDHDAFALDFRRRVGLVFQNADVQLFNPTVFDEVAFAPLQLRWSKEEILRRVSLAMDQMEIQHLRHRPPHRLSGGEQKRVALASVLVLDPEVMLLDEPTAGLDPRSESQIIDLLMSWADSGRTVITATHDLNLVQDIADICFVMQNGRIVAEGDPAAILNDQSLLERANMVHTHRHRHASGLVHAHAHLHPHKHE